MSEDNRTFKAIKSRKSKITVITPTYNRQNYITEAINSVLSQTFIDFTYIIIDDGSTDDTQEIVSKLIKGQDNCFYIKQQNKGEAETVNLGWDLANSEYFLQLNSDDTIEPQLIEEMVSILDKNPDAIGAYSDFFVIDEEGEIIENFKNVDWNFNDALSAFSCYPAAPGAVIRKSAFKSKKKIKDSSYKYINDIKMLWDFALMGDYIYINKSLASWRSHSNGISTDRYKSIKEVMRWADYFFSKNDLPKHVKELEPKCRLSIDNHCSRLIIESNIDETVSFFVRYLSDKNRILTEEDIYLKNLNKDLIHKNSVMSAELTNMKDSLSWRITKPLRNANSSRANFMKRIRKGKRS